MSLGLLHGSQPDALVLCHDPRRTHMDGYEGFAIPPLDEVMNLHLLLARRTNPAARFVGIALNTSKLEPRAATQLLAATAERHSLPTIDPLRSDLKPVVQRALTY